MLEKLGARVKLGGPGGLKGRVPARLWPEGASDKPCRAGSLGSAPAVVTVP